MEEPSIRLWQHAYYLFLLIYDLNDQPTFVPRYLRRNVEPNVEPKVRQR